MDATANQLQLLDDTGTGTIVALLASDRGASRLVPLLAQHFRVLRYTLGNRHASVATQASELAGAIGELDGEAVGVIADTAAAQIALALAAAQPARVRALALIAPPAPEANYAELKPPIMALFGTRKMPSGAGQKMRAAIANCHLMLVYDADDDMADQRPEAVAAALKEFMLAGDRFLVTSKSGKLYP
jgi:pimeloyl-ACP methyl ester carboxylesterase